MGKETLAQVFSCEFCEVSTNIFFHGTPLLATSDNSSSVPAPVVESLTNKIAGLMVCNFIKKRHQHKCFPVNIAKFLKTALFIEYLWWLLL